VDEHQSSISGHYHPFSPPSPERGVSAQLFTNIYYSIGGVQTWSQGRRREGRTAGGQGEPDSSHHVPSLRTYTRQHSWHQSTNKMQQSSHCQSIFQAPRRNKGHKGMMSRMLRLGRGCLSPGPW
jgi:hypothetical protein